MKRSPFTVYRSVAIMVLVACYDPKSPNLPPCDPNGGWPDPCYGALSDAGTDAEAGRR